MGQNTPYDAIECAYSRTPYLYSLEGTGECVTKWVESTNYSRKRITQNASVPPTMDPRDMNKIAFRFVCVQSRGIDSLPNEHYNHLLIYSNVPYAFKMEKVFRDYYCYKTLDDCIQNENEILMTQPAGFWCAPAYSSAGGSIMTDYGCSIIHLNNGKTSPAALMFHYTNKEGFSTNAFDGVLLSNITESYLFDLILDAAKNAEMTIQSLKGGTSIYPNIESMDDACAEWQNRNLDYRSSSSEKEYSSSSQFSSSSKETSSSSEELISSSSSYGYSSSDEIITETSSSEANFAYSSSSDVANEPFVAGPDQVYSLDQIFNSGLQNMEEGKCYSLNPERGSQYGWINNNAQDPWWWIETPCDGSLPIVEKTSAGCVQNKRGANAVYNPGDCFSSGLDNMTPGKCYSLNPERGTQYGWISNDARDTWWWIETPCEKENNKGLYKKATRHVLMTENDDVSQEVVKQPSFSYDALGRTMNRQNAFGKNRSVYGKIRVVR